MDNFYSYDGLFSDTNTSKLVCLSFAVIAVPVNVVLLLSIICYQRSGSGAAKQTLINKFLSSACWTCIEFILFVQVPILPKVTNIGLHIFVTYIYIVHICNYL
jgi:hypothetical protein